MLQEIGRTFAISRPMGDVKVFGAASPLPEDISQIGDFLNQPHEKIILKPGGMMGNTLTAYLWTADNARSKLHLFGRIGRDRLGEVYRQNTSSKLGAPQVDPREHTDAWVSIINQNTGQGIGADFIGAGGRLVVTKEDLLTEPNQLFLTDMATFKSPQAFQQVEMALDRLHGQALFGISLGGIFPQPIEQVDALFSCLKQYPDIVFGTETEVAFAARAQTLETAVSSAFPNATLLVTTRAERGSVVRFDDRILPIDPYPVKQVVDETGAGDNFMGMMLGLLFTKPLHEWRTDHVEDAAKAASYGSAMLVQTDESRLSQQQGKLVRHYFEALRTQKVHTAAV